MKVLVTGGAGFIGSHLVDQLINNGDEVLIWDNLSSGKKENLNPKATFELIDIACDKIDCKNSPNVDVIYHLAAMARIQPSFESPIDTHDINVSGTIRMLELARKLKCKFVYSGSSSFYAGPHKNPYSCTKWFGEEYCKLYNQVYGVPTFTARFFNVYGPRQICCGDYATVIGIFETQFNENKPLTITGDGNQRRDFTHVQDIVDGLILMQEKGQSCKIFNLGTGVNYSLNEIAAMFHQISYFDSPDDLITKLKERSAVVYLDKRLGEADHTLADISFTIEKLGWKPNFSLPEYIQKFLKTTL